MKARINLTPEPDVLGILREQPSASAYISRLVRDTESTWRACLDRLRASGWSASEVLASCDALNGYHLLPEVRPATWAAVDLADADLVAKWELDEDGWRAAIQRVHTDEIEARCLLEVCAQFWRFDPRVEAAIRALTRETT